MQKHKLKSQHSFHELLNLKTLISESYAIEL